jgi:hypothetical protein
MKKYVIITCIFWVFWFIGVSLYVEHIISRPMNGFIQLATTILGLILTVALINKTVKLFNNLKINKND